MAVPLVSACGYGFVAMGAAAVSRTIVVAQFENETTQVALGHDCAEALRDRLASPSSVSRDSADVAVLGRVISVEERPISLSDDGVGVETQVVVTVQVRAVAAGGPVLYDGEVTGEEFARTARSGAGTSAARQRAARGACGVAMDRLVDALVDALEEE
jgi:outer membrane lipopolysaccharide assembly protein LptE/RlpB